MRIIQDLVAAGHQNVLAEHPTTLEITAHSHLSKSGDCVVAVKAHKGLAALSNDFKNMCRNDDAKITLELRVGRLVEYVEGRGSKELTLSDPNDIVVRKSTHISDRTIMICASKAAVDLRRDFVQHLQSPTTTVFVRFIVDR